MSKLVINVYLRESAIRETRGNIITGNEIHAAAKHILFKQLFLSYIYSEYKGGTDWFLPGESKEDAMKKKIINDLTLTDNADDLLFQDLKDDFPGVVCRIWNKHDDVIWCQNYIQSNFSLFLYELSIHFDDVVPVTRFAFKVMDEIVSSMSPKIIQVETNNYTLKQRKVFPDRLPVGWMFYTDKLYEPGTIVAAKHMRQINKDGIPAGTLFITKPGFFDGANKQDIQISNNMEIILTSHGILPTYQTIF